MELEYLNQKQLLIDGVPATCYGEWPGIKSSHWKGSLKIIRPKTVENIFDENAILPISGRRHFSAQRSNEMITKPARKLFTEIKNAVNIEDKKLGLKAVRPIFSQNKYDYPKRHYSPRFGMENDPERFHIRTFFPDGNTRTFQEIPISREMGRRQRILSLTAQRNGMLIKAPGDKFYKNPEHTFSYFKEGGLIPGSTNALNNNRTISKKGNNYYDTLDLSVKTLDTNKIWGNKIKQEIKAFDEIYVKSLSTWDETVLKDYNLPKLTERSKKGEVMSERSKRGEVEKKTVKSNNKPNIKSLGKGKV